MPFTLHGIPVSRGISIGRAHMLARAALDVSHYLVDEDKVDAEVERLRSARATVRAELAALKRDLPTDVPEEMGAFLDVHAMILDDALLSQVPETLIRQRRYNAEWALTTQLEELIRQFGEIEDEYLRERKADIEQVVERILKVLAGAPALAPAPVAVGCDPDAGMIVVAHDIAPADMLQFRGQTFAGFVTDLGGRTSHTAIVARSLDIPAAVGVHNASTLIRQDDIVVIDGDNGIVIVDPSASILEEYRHRRSEGELQKKRLERLRHTPTVTLDGTQIDLHANIEMPEDAAAAVKAGAVGVGLFRSEFLFMNRRGALPDEEEQFRAYRTAVESMMGLPVTIRTIDIGADKPLDIRDDVFETAPNPALGLRAIRWSLSEPAMFLTQLRALLRASAFGPIKILVPMLAHAREIDQTLELLARAKASLDADGVAYDPTIKVGAMIEIPAAVLILPVFLRRMDFLSIGTNDLIQYTLAIDRADNAVAHLYDPLHPAVLQLIARTIREGHQAGKPVSVCGEMAGDASMTRLLLGMGLTEFSMHPSQLLSVKQQILRSDRPRLMREADRLLHACEPAEIEEALGALARA
ncbi:MULTISPECIES: phosphoenolpyruvate--protein phosphotransferase [Ralstonia]|jgi:phosphotransferase system enzyme I (PtsI)|uniref:Phosphoenolpyruvate-protein phosphotransferase n=1 Tax=Ralstonia mojiangensis TaxID=2953895 RepID=A0AAE3L9F0_9RALS|nr:phosphoenolpyruvate--protein phosphotransferase [Ralstonia mojiangensis]MCO5411709.1 phosphoenolpyruvate--protein phosphotransferase [Ralstonia mojiangensis]MCT7296060.1 phosphoenolpyruvate--protein phosphotransferase [Ralstonia mojiangensis]MCT7310533.1 phosphoenolpyruvate--protein phosphotransferase [Ralstonia mojiangensis]MCT7314658.1 phosphoenolpyruvate--protein phosphotransferase [Ralstonia mojiangensis]MCT7326482.1 phosphoenolpyruvate--protein phosphotransferase [Ralstonia mojiangensi